MHFSRQSSWWPNPWTVSNPFPHRSPTHRPESLEHYFISRLSSFQTSHPFWIEESKGSKQAHFARLIRSIMSYHHFKEKYFFFVLECHLYNGLVMIYKLFVMKCVVLLLLSASLKEISFLLFFIMIKDLNDHSRVRYKARGKADGDGKNPYILIDACGPFCWRSQIPHSATFSWASLFVPHLCLLRYDCLRCHLNFRQPTRMNGANEYTSERLRVQTYDERDEKEYYRW